MSSSNRVRLTAIAETSIGVTPGAGNFKTLRFTSESLSGTPKTTKSQQIRSDRLSSGQVVTGLEVGGDINFELAKEAPIDLLIESAMLSTWGTLATQTVDLTIDATAKTVERVSGDWNVTLVVGDIVTFSAFSNSVNNTQFQVLEVVSATVVRGTFNESGGAVVDEAGTGTSYLRADKISIGTTKKSFTLEKAFLDLTNKALIYPGMMVDTFDLNVTYGQIVSGSFGLVGTGYTNADADTEFATFGRTIDAASTSNSMNGSIDMPFVNSDAVGTLDEVTFCIQSLALNLKNNMNALNCIGLPAPQDYSAGEAGIEVKLNAYLSDSNWAILSKKLTQTPFALGGMVKNSDGFYGFYMPAVQVSLNDPASGGSNQDISLDMSGTAKVGASGEKSLTLYRG